MPPFAEYLLKQLDELARWSGGPVRTVVLADTLGIPPRTTRWYAARLEDAGLVGRLSPRGGWLPARRVPPREGPPRQLCLPGFADLLAA